MKLKEARGEETGNPPHLAAVADLDKLLTSEEKIMEDLVKEDPMEEVDNESGSRQLFVLDQSWSSSSPVDLFIPASLLNKSSLKPSFIECLSSELGRYV